MQLTGEQILSYLTGLIMLALIILIAWRVTRYLSKSNITLGDYLNKNFIREQPTYIVVALIGFCLAEAFLASAIQVEAEFISPIARTIAHFFIGYIGIVIIIGTPRAASEMAKSWAAFKFKNKKRDPATKKLVLDSNGMVQLIDPLNQEKIGYFFISLVGFLIMIGLDIFVPYTALMIIAVGLQKHFEAQMAFLELFVPWFDATKYCIEKGIIEAGEIWNTKERMGYTLYASFQVFIFHIFLGFFDGVIALQKEMSSNIELKSKAKNVQKNINDRGKADKVSADDIQLALEDISQPIELLIKYTEVGKNDNWITKKVDHFTEKFYDTVTYPTQAQANLTSRIVKLANKAVQLEADPNDVAYASKKSVLQREILQLFKTSPTNGNGFGEELTGEKRKWST